MRLKSNSEAVDQKHKTSKAEKLLIHTLLNTWINLLTLLQNVYLVSNLEMKIWIVMYHIFA